MPWGEMGPLSEEFGSVLRAIDLVFPDQSRPQPRPSIGHYH